MAYLSHPTCLHLHSSSLSHQSPHTTFPDRNRQLPFITKVLKKMTAWQRPCHCVINEHFPNTKGGWLGGRAGTSAQDPLSNTDCHCFTTKHCILRSTWLISLRKSSTIIITFLVIIYNILNSSLYPNKCVFLSTWLTKSLNQSAVPPCPHLDAFAWLWVLEVDTAIYNFKILAFCDKKT